MYRGFKLEIKDSEWDFFANNYRYRVKDAPNPISDYLENKKALDGKAMKEGLFPQLKADIFISHSHDDVERAKSLAGWLEGEFKVKTFIDATIWGDYRSLLRDINDKYCKTPRSCGCNGEDYSYEAGINSASHIHMLLLSALHEMIDNTECFFFISTPNSVKIEQAAQGKDTKGKTYSPWIYYELGISRIVRKRLPFEHRGVRLSYDPAKSSGEAQSLAVSHEVDLGHLKPIHMEDLISWESEFKRDSDAKERERKSIQEEPEKYHQTFIERHSNPLDYLYERFSKKSEKMGFTASGEDGRTTQGVYLWQPHKPEDS